MDDLREKVIRGLECCILHDPDDKRRCSDCPYNHHEISNAPCANGLKFEALSLLKVQEPVEPIEMINDFYPIGDPLRTEGWKCGKCGQEIAWDDNYCSKCGTAVKWE